MTPPYGSDSPRVSVVVPVFNAERYLRRCLDSVLCQTMPELEVIAVNDGSTDASLTILEEYAAVDSRIRVLDQPNAGQGEARNRALELARGEYVLFVDADDFVEKVLLQVTIERADEDDSDFVHFDWKFASSDPSRPDQFHYYNIEPFWHHRELRGPECELLFQMHSYFSVTNLYRRSFLQRHAIRYETGQIYEDNPFLTKAFTRAECVSMVHSPLYVIQMNPKSSTKVGTDTDRHMRDHLSAMQKSFDVLVPRREESVGELAEYHLDKFSTYYMRRVPRRLRDEYAAGFIAIISKYQPRFLTLGRTSSWLTRLCVAARVFERERPLILQRAIEMRSWIAPPSKRLLLMARKLKRRLRNPRQSLAVLRSGRNPSIRPRSIVFLGFDERYTGNSRALFEEILEDARFRNFHIQFTTKDPAVPDSHRLAPSSPAFFEAVRSARIVIAESWIPESVPKHPDSTWIQLWHGTPIKRMLFDSHEREITRLRPQHKVRKYRDILRWDYLLVENEYAASKFETAFLFPRERMITASYPRNERLIGDALNTEKRDRLRAEHGIAADQFTALYVPTWRDYNYGLQPEKRTREYLLDVEAVSNLLGSEFTILFRDHEYLQAAHADGEQKAAKANPADIHDLLLMCDVVITDYSSALFDALHIGSRTIGFAIDNRKFEEVRGVYKDAALTFDTFCVSAEEVAIELRRMRDSSDRPVRTRPCSIGAPNDSLLTLLLAL
ncbi:CDP-glycerol glycerophosphotransferase family protein [Leucobacter sp. USHLN153]|uniref:CDP-glycerol glycerophosphotransferase family protein n=1 Tax=Leucobacter sp. USHLN153 TaxID=3081268 RepID=UPI003016FD7D